MSQYELSLSTVGQCTLNLLANRILYVIEKIVFDSRKQYLNEEIWPPDLSIFPFCDVSFTQNIQQTPILVRETGGISLNVPVNGEPEKLKKTWMFSWTVGGTDFLNSVFNNYSKKIKRNPHAKPNQTKTNKQINKPKEHPKQSKVPCITTQFLQYTIKYIFRRGIFLWKL